MLLGIRRTLGIIEDIRVIANSIQLMMLGIMLPKDLLVDILVVGIVVGRVPFRGIQWNRNRSGDGVGE